MVRLSSIIKHSSDTLRSNGPNIKIKVKGIGHTPMDPWFVSLDVFFITTNNNTHDLGVEISTVSEISSHL